MNIQVVVLSIIALICLYLMFTVDWLFIVPAVIIMFINQKNLMNNKKR